MRRKHEPSTGSRVPTLDLFASEDALPSSGRDQAGQVGEGDLQAARGKQEAQAQLGGHQGKVLPGASEEPGVREREARGEGSAQIDHHDLQDAGQRRGDTSIEAFAQRQADLYVAGEKSASAYWRARGVMWPRK